MTDKAKTVLSRALKLPAVERAELVESLYRSLETMPEATSVSRDEIDKRWAEEAESRIKGYEEGKLSAKPAEDAFSRVNKRSVNAD